MSGLIALVLVLAITSIDLVFGTPATSKLSALRLGVLCPLLLLLAAAISLPVARRYYTEIVSVGVTLVGFVVTYIAHAAALAGASYVLAGLVLVVLFGCLFLGLLFNVAMGVAALLISAHLVSGLVVGLPIDMLSYMTAILGAAAVIGGIATYNLEYALRTNFLETRQLNELAERDGMTGLYNRRLFDDYILRIWRQSRREDVGVAIVFVDIDFFKIFNDLYGHQAGDDCLKQVANCIARGAKRPFDFSARYGGEEFVVVLYGPPDDYAREHARADSPRRARPRDSPRRLAGCEARDGQCRVVDGAAALDAQPRGRDPDGRRSLVPGQTRRPEPRDLQRLRGFRRRDRQLPRRPARPRLTPYHDPVFGIDAQGSAFGSASPFWSNSTEMLSGERTKAIRPSRGGRWIVTPAFKSLLHSA